MIEQFMSLMFILTLCGTAVGLMWIFCDYCWHLTTRLEHWFYVLRFIRVRQELKRLQNCKPYRRCLNADSPANKNVNLKADPSAVSARRSLAIVDIEL